MTKNFFIAKCCNLELESWNSKKNYVKKKLLKRDFYFNLNWTEWIRKEKIENNFMILTDNENYRITNQTTRNVVARFCIFSYRDVVEWKASIIVLSILNHDFFIIISEFQLVNSYAIILWINFKQNGIKITRTLKTNIIIFIDIVLKCVVLRYIWIWPSTAKTTVFFIYYKELFPIWSTC